MQIRPIPQQRVIEKMDEYMSRRDYAGAERHLLYWLEEAKQGRDLRGQLMVRNELIGHFRKTANRERALENVDQALHLLHEMDFSNSISAGTTYVNAATACNAFGENERAMELFEKARAVYETQGGKPAVPGADPQLLGGLYNNMALTCVALAGEARASCDTANRKESGDTAERNAAEWFDRAFSLYKRALEQMRRVTNGELEQAITYLNMADAREGRDGPEAAEKEIETLLDTAYDLLQTPSVPRDGYYAFVCEKCAPTFSYYGYFLAADDLQKKADELYGRKADEICGKREERKQ